MATEPKRSRELEDAIDGVLASYTGKLEIDNLESAALPNKRAVVERIGSAMPSRASRTIRWGYNPSYAKVSRPPSFRPISARKRGPI